MLLVARTPRAAAFFSKSFSGRTARKVYWALVVGVPAIEDGMIDLPLAKQPGTGGEKMHVDEAEGPAGADPLPGDRARRQPRRLGRAAAAHRPHPPAARPHGWRSAIRSSATANMAGQDAFLTGAISRKLHLHARRLRIDHPDGGRIDVTAELPDHFAASMASLGFDPRSATCRSTRSNISETPEGKRKAASAAAKARRKERKGERRSRGRG